MGVRPHLLIAAVWYGGLVTSAIGARAATAAGAPAGGAALLRRFRIRAAVAKVPTVTGGLSGWRL